MTDELGWSRVVTLHGRVEQELAKALQRQHGLGLSEYRALAQLAATECGELRIQELADAIGLNQSSVSRLVARLEEAGLTRRDLCANDRRGVYSVITDAGRKRLATAAPVYTEVLTQALDRAAADAELGGAVRAVRAL
ncbi:MarR family transcriptional regulator [Kutzneria viridogrisea]|uniref:DNA-binding MarR family transcriptional regulator n=1 Tax=Kutzneria viridogrisea TaxID=47990 RepID=A0ABR6BRA0_9PSEU|nr:DNA-binding MarR family transcriptional regulator [Kutzneria viridogrisea]